MTENLEFSVFLSGTFWNKKPQYSILIDDTVVFSGAVNEATEEIKFSHTVTEDLHTLSIRLENKTSNDTVLVNGIIEKDMLLNIEDISINDISLGQLLWDTTYVLDEPQIMNGEQITSLQSCVNLGWNGTYQFTFSSPFYIWLLERL